MSRLQETHQLIHGLNKSDKKSFRIYGSNTKGSGGSQIRQLYDLLLEVVEFDKSKLMKLILERGLLKNLPTLMRRLSQQIFLSQRNLYANRSVDSQLMNALEEISFLFRKNLIPGAMRTLKRARKLADKFSRSQISIQLIRWERRILRDSQPQGLETKYARLRKEELRLVDLLTLQLKLVDMASHLREAGRKSVRSSSPETMEEFKKMIDFSLIEEGLIKSDFLCRAYAKHALGISQIIDKAFGPAFETYFDLMTQWESEPQWPAEDVDFFLSTWNNYHQTVIYGTTEVKHLQRFLPFIRQVPILEDRYKLKLSRISYQSELLVYMNQENFNEGLPLVEEITVWLKRNENQLRKSFRLAFYFNLTVFFFLKEDFSRANQEVLKILNLKGVEERPDIRNMARIFQIILQWELGNPLFSESLHRSALRYFQGNEDFSFESQLVALYSPVGMNASKTKRNQMLSQLLEFLEEHDPKVSGKPPVLGQLEMKLWATSKLSGKAILELYFQYQKS